MIEKCKIYIKKNYLTILAYLFVIVGMCIIQTFYVFVFDDFKDSSSFIYGNVEKASSTSVWQDVIIQYKYWEGSWPIQFIRFFIIRHLWCFKTLNLFICALVVWSMAQLISDKKYRHLWAALLFFFFPMGTMTTAGVAVTSVVYLWVAAMGMYALTLTYRIMHGIKIRTWEYVVGLPALIIGSSREQSGIFMVIFLAGVICYNLINKNNGIRYRYIFLQWIAALLTIISVLLAPGLKCKATRTMAVVHPQLISETIGEKIYDGIAGTLNYFLSNCHLIVLCMVILLAILVFEKHQEIIPRMVSVYTIVYLVILWTSWRGGHMSWLFGKIEFITSYNFDSVKSYIPFIAQMLWLGCVLAEFWWALENTEEFWAILFGLGGGIATTIALGFTGSIHSNSGSRTYSFFYWVMIAVTLFLVYRNKKIMKSRTAMLSVFCISCMNILNLILTLREYGGHIGHWLLTY